jgi:hypothetical protein
MDHEVLIRGSLARLLGDVVPEAALLHEFEAHGLTAGDARLVLDKALLEGFVERAGDGVLRKLPAATQPSQPTQLPQP